MKHKAFTLIELLVVVAIIGILAAVGVVAYNGYTSSAKKAVMKSNLQSIKKYITAEMQKCPMDMEMEGYLKGVARENCNWSNGIMSEQAFAVAQRAIQFIHFKDNKSLNDNSKSLVDWNGSVPPKDEHLGRIMCFWNAADAKGKWEDYMKNNKGWCTAKWGSGKNDYYIEYFYTLYDLDYHRGNWK